MKPSELPFVSVCTPTFNRRQFIPYIIECFEQQDYPKERMEWVIVDDGSNTVEDLVSHIPHVIKAVPLGHFLFAVFIVLGDAGGALLELRAKFHVSEQLPMEVTRWRR